MEKIKGLQPMFAALRIKQTVSFDECQRLFGEMRAANCITPPNFEISGNEWCALVNLAVSRFANAPRTDAAAPVVGDDKLVALIDALKRMRRETIQMKKRATNLRSQAAANSCAIELRRIKHEAHCLAVEIGIADRRSDAAYADATAPAGMGRDFLMPRRTPAA
jgi:hypothetical protein